MSTYTEDFSKKIIEAVEAYKKETKGNAAASAFNSETAYYKKKYVQLLAARADDLGFFLVRDIASDEASETYRLYHGIYRVAGTHSLNLRDHCSLEEIEAFLDAVERINNGLLDD